MGFKTLQDSFWKPGYRAQGRILDLLGRVLSSQNTCMGRLKMKSQRTYKMAMFYHKVVSNELGREILLEPSPFCPWW